MYFSKLRNQVVASLVLVFVLSAVYAGSWWMDAGHSSFVQGEPAPRTYYSRYRMKYVDEQATRELRQKRQENLLGVLVREQDAISELGMKLERISAGEVEDILPGDLAALLQELSAPARGRVLNAVSDTGLYFLEEEPGEYGEEAVWRLLDETDLESAEKNLAFQIIDHLMKPVAMIDPEATSEYRSYIREQVQPIERNISTGDVIIREGELITPDISAILRSQGYPERVFPYEGYLVLLALALAWLAWYWWYQNRSSYPLQTKEWGFLVTALSAGWVFQFLSRFYGGEGFGILAMGAWLYLCFPAHLGFQLVLGAGILGAFASAGASLTEIILSSTIALILAFLGYLLLPAVDKRRRLFRFLAVMGSVSAVIVLMCRYGLGLDISIRMAATYFLSVFFWTILAVALLPVWESVFDILTPTRLVDLSHPSHPLLKRLQLEAPGTYHHSLMVGTLAEVAAEKLMMKSLIVKAGAYYHDIGKLRRPQFFVENQQAGENAHDALAPTMSALVIVSHVRDGLEMARKYKLPRRICDFIQEHHGTTCLQYFFKKAQSAEQEIPVEQFCYPGPKPASRETALIMLADSVEAAVRSAGSTVLDTRDIQDIVADVIETKVQEGQMDHVDLTLREISVIRESFIESLRHMYHTRQVKPVEEKKPEAAQGRAADGTEI
ncbi:MAG: HD family phosphohydrolase [Thermovirgaceae bacterium]